MYNVSKYFFLGPSDKNFESQDADRIPSQHISFKFHGIGPLLRMWLFLPCQEIPRFHGTQKFITAVKISQLDPIINTNNQHSHILFIYDALHVIFLPSPQLPSDLFPWGEFLSLLRTFYIPYQSHNDSFNHLIMIWCKARYMNLYDISVCYGLDNRRYFLPAQVFFSPSCSNWLWGQQFSYAINTGEFLPDSKADSAWNWPPTSIW
jgi:hypothetical protein